MSRSSDVIREEFLSLAERLRLDTTTLPLNIIGTPEYTPPTFIEKKIGQRTIEICVGPYLPDIKIRYDDEASTNRLSDGMIESLVDVYKELFLPNRQIRFIGVDLDDCLYDVTPARQLLVQEIDSSLPNTPNKQHNTAWALYEAFKDELGSEDVKKQKAASVLASSGITSDFKGIEGVVDRAYRVYKDFSTLDTPRTRSLYTPYEGVKDTLRHLMDDTDLVIGILTNGPSKFQRDKIDLLGLKEGEHYNFVMTSGDVGINKPGGRFFELARERGASHLTPAANTHPSGPGGAPLRNEDCLILDDQIKNISGAGGWLKVQFLRGYHTNVRPEDIKEAPKYVITRFSTLPDLLSLERDSDFQALSAGCFILKMLLLLRTHTACNP